MAINCGPLLQQLKDAGIPVDNIVDIDGIVADLVIHYSAVATQAQITSGEVIHAAYDPNNPYVSPTNDARARWAASAVHGKTPAQIYTLVQGQVNAWTTLAQAKTDLAVWLPLIIAGLSWTIFKDQQQ